MHVTQFRWTETEGWTPFTPSSLNGTDLLLIFGSPAALLKATVFEQAREAAGDGLIFGCSTAGEILGTSVSDEAIVGTAIRFDSTRLAGTSTPIANVADSYDAGVRIAASLPAEGLVHVLVLSDGIHVNGSKLVAGLRNGLPDQVTITGGLAGDGGRFVETFVVMGGAPVSKSVAAVGFYGDKLRVGYGSMGGWDPFGPERLITSAAGNVLLELDGRSALELYKEYLGDHAEHLPASALLFPLSIRSRSDDSPVVRTVLSVSEADQSMTFAGDIPVGSYARLMKANFDRLIDGAATAARRSSAPFTEAAPDLALLISCVGRKLLLRQRIEEEVEGVRDVFGDRTPLAGFYSHGEISPFTPNARCEVHNQTMTITTFSEL